MKMFKTVDENLIERISESRSDNFVDLVRVSGLDPKTDFEFADLQDADFTGCDLSGFNFQYADLRGAIWDADNLIEPARYRFALRGRHRDAISGLDHQTIFSSSLTSKTWGERFFSFALAVDNFGVSEILYDLQVQITDDDKSKYMRFCSYTYLLGSYFQHTEATNYCRTMASEGRAQTQMFRFKKLMRFLDELLKYGDRLRDDFTFHRAKVFPGAVSASELLSHADYLIRKRE